MPQAARNWAETGALLCEVLAAELEQLTCASQQKGSLQPKAAQPQSSPSLQQRPCNCAISNGRSEAREGHSPLKLEQATDLGRRPSGRGSKEAAGSGLLAAPMQCADDVALGSGSATCSGSTHTAPGARQVAGGRCCRRGSGQRRAPVHSRATC